VEVLSADGTSSTKELLVYRSCVQLSSSVSGTLSKQVIGESIATSLATEGFVKSSSTNGDSLRMSCAGPPREFMGPRAN